MNIEKIRDFNNVYDTINYSLIDIEKEIEPFETVLNSNGMAYEMGCKSDNEKKLKIILVKIKKLSKNVKQFEKNVKEDNEIKKLFYPKAKVILQKYTEILKRLLIVNDKYATINKYNKTKIANSEDVAINIDGSEEKKFQQLTQVANENVINAYNNTMARNNEITKLSAEIRELYDMFQDFAILVDSQHEQIISIDSIIEDSQIRVQKGNEKLTQVIQLQKKTRKKYCCCVLILVLIIIIVLSVLGGLSFNVV